MTTRPVSSGPTAGLTPRQIRERTIRALATRAETRSERRRQELLEYVVSINMGIAHGVVSGYVGRGLAPEGLQQVAHAALTRAARDFEPDCRHEFQSFALPVVRREIGVHLRDRRRTVRPPLGTEGAGLRPPTRP